MMRGKSRVPAVLLACLIGFFVVANPDRALAQVASPAGDADGGKASASAGAGAQAGPSVPAVAEGRAAAVAKPGVGRASVVRILLNANPVLWLLLICSVITLAYVLERLYALRKERVIPHEFAARFLERLSNGKLDRERALELCKAHESPAARIFALVVNSWGQPGATIRQTLSYDTAGEIIELKRNLRVLSAMGTLGPLLGLLGTVVGIIQSFDALGGRVGPARGEALAHGISLALVATALGLAIAIVAVAFYYFFLNRVDLLVRELDDRTRQVIDLVASESQRVPGADRRHVPMRSEPQRHESRVI
jgi:biopolymer transport protein ExbB